MLLIYCSFAFMWILPRLNSWVCANFGAGLDVKTAKPMIRVSIVHRSEADSGVGTKLTLRGRGEARSSKLRLSYYSGVFRILVWGGASRRRRRRGGGPSTAPSSAQPPPQTPGERAQPPPQTHPPAGRGTPPPRNPPPTRVRFLGRGSKILLISCGVWESSVSSPSGVRSPGRQEFWCILGS